MKIHISKWRIDVTFDGTTWHEVDFKRRTYTKSFLPF